jgi:hypothetical protein
MPGSPFNWSVTLMQQDGFRMFVRCTQLPEAQSSVSNPVRIADRDLPLNKDTDSAGHDRIDCSPYLACRGEWHRLFALGHPAPVVTHRNNFGYASADGG